jgi:hypothetical protein
LIRSELVSQHPVDRGKVQDRLAGPTEQRWMSATLRAGLGGQAGTLAQEYEVAKGTAEKALGVLREDGLVRTVPGRGIYVVPR